MDPTGVLVDDYELEEPLGRGGMAVVWGAVRRSDHLPTAVKWLRAEHVRREDLVARFAREQAVLRSLVHPNVVRVLDAGEHDGRPWFAMERLGLTLQQRVLIEGPLGHEEAVLLARELAAGVKALHALGVIHRDIKPSNLLYGPDGAIRVADLGIAAKPADPRITADAAVLGSVKYMAPEQRYDAHRVDVRADVYSMAATLRFALTGKAQRDLWRDQGAALDGIPDGWGDGLAAALGWDPSLRPDTVDAFLERLPGR